MAVIDSNQTVSNNTSGFEKGIHSSAKKMMMDNSQLYMYTKPIQSAVRECVSNAVDSTKEKNVAIAILTGKAKVSDHYLTQEDVKDKITTEEDNIYQDSEFDPNYYDLNWLNPVDTIKLTYVVNEQTKRDQFIIEDNGVGLGGHRLEGFFNLGYSSKRLNTNELGGFGLGAKSPLSTGVESFRMISRYNGREFCYDIYSHKVDCVYGKWNDDGTSNDYYEFETYKMPNGSPIKAYYKKTNQKNGVILTIDVRKHNKQQYFEAVKSQLMYLKEDIIFGEQQYMGSLIPVPFKANIIYEDDNIILSDYNYYSRPHFVLKNVGYGLIDFGEMDLAPKFGNIGIKLKMEDIQVTPSRETVIYSNKTRNAYLQQDSRVVSTVQQRVEGLLNQDDFLEWLRACNKVMYNTSSSNKDVTSILANLIDKTALKPVHKPSKIAFDSNIENLITPLLFMEHVAVERSYDYRNSKNKKKINKTVAKEPTAFDRHIYLQFSPGNIRTTSYLANLHEKESGYCVIRNKSNITYLDVELSQLTSGEITSEEFMTAALAKVIVEEPDAVKQATIKKNLEKVIKFISLLKDHQDVHIYSEDLVPNTYKVGKDIESGEEDEFDDSGIDFEAEEEARRKAQYKETLKRRRENKTFIAGILVNKSNSAYSFKPGYDRREIKTSDLDFANTKVVYGTDADDEVLNLLVDIERANNKMNVASTYYWNDEVKAMKVSKSNLKYVKDQGIHVNEFVINVDRDGTLTSFNKIKQSFTADIISKVLGKNCNFLCNFAEFSIELTNDYEKLMNYIKVAPRIVHLQNAKDAPAVKTLLAAYTVQSLLLEHPSMDEDDKQDLIDENIPNDLDLDIIDIDLIDTEMYELAVKVAAFGSVYSCILNHIDPLRDAKKNILDSDLVIEIWNIINTKKDQLEYQYENINK